MLMYYARRYELNKIMLLDIEMTFDSINGYSDKKDKIMFGEEAHFCNFPISYISLDHSMVIEISGCIFYPTKVGVNPWWCKLTNNPYESKFNQD